MKTKINFGVIGLGHRGVNLLNDVLVKFPDIKIVALCDSYRDLAEKTAKEIEKKTNYLPQAFTDYKNVLELKNLDAILVSTSWEDHIKVTCDALKKGIATAMEVGAAYDMNELWDLVKTWEKTNTPFMFMENCCFDKHELMATAMERDGFFGKVVHCCGAYSHDLREEISSGNIKHHYRLRNYINRNCDNYPTHEIGPIAKLLKINAGNRFKSLVSISSKACGLHDYINKKENKKTFKDLLNQKFKQGDVVNTIITCENGETIEIKLDTTLPHSYDRNFIVEGTKAYYNGSTHSVFLDGDKEEYFTEEWFKSENKNAEKYEQKYLPSYWKNITNEILKSGHGGMDYFEFRYFLDCIKNNTKPSIDVYDAATWMQISVLSEESIKNNGAPQKFVDFTRGKWKTNKPQDLFKIKIK